MLLIDCVVMVVMVNVDYVESGGLYVYVKDDVDGLIVADSMDEFAEKVRVYL